MDQPTAPSPLVASAPLPHRRTRPAGISPGTGAFVAAWIVGAAIARLTGAAAVLLLLAIGVIGLAAAGCSGWLAARKLRVSGVAVPTVVNVDAETTITIMLSTRLLPRGSVRVFADAGRRDVLAMIPFEDFTPHHGTSHIALGPIAFRRPGIVERLHVEAATAGAAGLMWFRHTTSVPIEQRFSACPRCGAQSATAASTNASRRLRCKAVR